MELTLKGWRVTSLQLDCMVGDFMRLEMFTTYFDSLYELLDIISPGYRNSFGEELTNKLRCLQVNLKFCMLQGANESTDTSDHAPSTVIA